MFEELSTSYCKIDEDVAKRVLATQCAYFAPLCKLPPEKIATDLLNPAKSVKQADILARYVSLEKKDILEIGSGLGINLISWTHLFSACVTGIEAEARGFDSSISLSRQLLRKNGLPIDLIIEGRGDNLPFPSESYDVVYSTNVLEHVGNPVQVLREGLRVLKRGGILQYVFPNYHSFFDGHYAVFHPPVFGKSFFPWYVKNVWHRDPAYARTLRTELSVFWTRRQLNDLKKEFAFDVLSMGEDVFMDRMLSGRFSPWAGLSKVKKTMEVIMAWHLNRPVAYVLVGLGFWSPIILTLKKK